MNPWPRILFMGNQRDHATLIGATVPLSALPLTLSFGVALGPGVITEHEVPLPVDLTAGDLTD